MEDQGSSSRYVKLEKIQEAPAEDIQPGELNQPIVIPPLEVHKCQTCGQQLPETFQPPADEAWHTNIFGCEEDTESCRKGLFCPCVLFGQNVESMKDGQNAENIEGVGQCTPACVCHAIFIEGGVALAAAIPMLHGIDPDTALAAIEGLCLAWLLCATCISSTRHALQAKYRLQSAPCDPAMVHFCMHWCAICQEHREMKRRLSINIELPTMVEPPTIQEMSADESREAMGSGSGSTQQT